MNKNGGVLEVTLQNILCTINPLKEDWSKRFQVIDELRAVVQAMESLRGIQNMFSLSLLICLVYLWRFIVVIEEFFFFLNS